MAEWTVVTSRKRKTEKTPVTSNPETEIPETELPEPGIQDNGPTKLCHPNERYTATDDKDIYLELDDRYLSYRMGWPRLPPLPLRNSSRDAHLWISDPDTIISQVGALFKSCPITWLGAGFTYRTPYNLATVRHGLDDHHTFLVLVEYPCKEQLGVVCRLIVEICKILMQQADTRYTYIEVIDHRATPELRSYAIEPGHQFWSRQELIRETVMQEIVEQGQACLRVKIMRRGLFQWERRALCPVTVVVSTLTADDEVWWKVIIPRARRRLDGILKDVMVKVLQGADDGSAVW
jgi:hypothetical protein